MQQTNLYTVTVPSLLKHLQALSMILEKAEKHADSKKTSRSTFEHALLSDHIIFDQFPFVKQVQVACDNAKGLTARLAEIESPKHEDNEKTLAELRERIAKTVAFVQSVKPEQIIGKEDIKTTLPYFAGKYMTGFEYAIEYAMPNFYFHLSTAYNLLRKNGIDIGKNDFMGSLPLKDI
ncbi:MAG: DUF1993 domain-containing protein [Patescibacteria group bacterium]